MPTVRASAVVHASSRAIFSFIADYHNIPLLQPQFTSARLVSDVERGLGANVELRGHFHGIPLHVHNRVISYSPPRRLVSVSEGAVASRSTWEIEEAAGEPPSSRVTLTIDYKLGNSFGSLFMGVGSALWPLFNREIQGLTNESLHRLRLCFDGKSR